MTSSGEENAEHRFRAHVNKDRPFYFHTLGEAALHVVNNPVELISWHIVTPLDDELEAELTDGQTKLLLRRGDKEASIAIWDGDREGGVVLGDGDKIMAFVKEKGNPVIYNGLAWLDLTASPPTFKVSILPEHELSPVELETEVGLARDRGLQLIEGIFEGETVPPFSQPGWE